jgi:hypothetical protein
MNKINVLVITKSPWAENSAFGNSLSNFFSGWHNVNFCNIYCREELPQNDICSTYFNITEQQLIKHLFSPRQIGRKFSCSAVEEKQQSQTDSRREKKLMNFCKNSITILFLVATEFLWKLGGWKNKQLDSFLHENNIDIIFAAAADPIYLQRIISYCRQQTNAALVLFFADDTYSYKTYSPLRCLYQYTLRWTIKNSVKNAAKLYGASPLLCEEYERYFAKPIEPLYKGCLFDNCEKTDSLSPVIKVVYAGNLFYGRWPILQVLAEEIEKINHDSVNMVLEIFTTATITPEIAIALNRGQSSRIMGALPYAAVKRVLQQADIVLHVESFESIQVKTTRLSFSTKIIDCMQSGSCMLAIGPGNIASIQYLRNIEGVMVVTDIKKLGELLSHIITNPSCIKENAEKLNRYARTHHDINLNRNRLQNDFTQLLLATCHSAMAVNPVSVHS